MHRRGRPIGWCRGSGAGPRRSCRSGWSWTTNADIWNFWGCLTNSGMPSALVPSSSILNETTASPSPDVLTLVVRFSADDVGVDAPEDRVDPDLRVAAADTEGAHVREDEDVALHLGVRLQDRAGEVVVAVEVQVRRHDEVVAGRHQRLRPWPVTLCGRWRGCQQREACHGDRSDRRGEPPMRTR